MGMSIVALCHHEYWAIPFNKHTPPMDDKYFEPCPEGSKTDFNDGKGMFWANLIMSKGERVTNYDIQGDASPF